MNTLTIAIPKITPEQFLEICQANQDLRLELTASGEVIIMPPTHPWTDQQNFGIIGQLAVWTERTGLGIGFDSSTGFTLPNSAVRSPDASWITNERWDSLTEKQKKSEFSPIAPDFVIELRSSSDSIKTLREKMQEYINNGVRLAWLIDPQSKQVEIYRQNQQIEILNSPDTVSGEDVLPGFVLNLNKIW